MLQSNYTHTREQRQALELAQEKMDEALAGYIEAVTVETTDQLFELINYLQEAGITLDEAKTSFMMLLKEYARATSDAQSKAQRQII